MSLPKLIPGEYDVVSKASLNPARLRASHETSCTPETAYFLIAVMHDHLFGNKVRAPFVRLRKPRAGQHKARGWGGVKNGRGYVSLPETPMVNKANPYGRLRVGLVVHEYTHAAEMLKFGDTSHGARFTMLLDSLLFHTEKYWSVK